MEALRQSAQLDKRSGNQYGCLRMTVVNAAPSRLALWPRRAQGNGVELEGRLNHPSFFQYSINFVRQIRHPSTSRAASPHQLAVWRAATAQPRRFAPYMAWQNLLGKQKLPERA